MKKEKTAERSERRIEMNETEMNETEMSALGITKDIFTEELIEDIKKKAKTWTEFAIDIRNPEIPISDAINRFCEKDHSWTENEVEAHVRDAMASFIENAIKAMQEFLSIDEEQS